MTLNEQVARRLGHPISGGMIALRATPHQPEYEIPNYSGDIAAASEIIGWLGENDYVWEMMGTATGARFAIKTNDGALLSKSNVDYEKNPLPMAIVLAFLALPEGQ